MGMSCRRKCQPPQLPAALRCSRLRERPAEEEMGAHMRSDYALLANVIVAGEGATFHDLPHFAAGIVPGDGIFTTWSCPFPETHFSKDAWTLHQSSPGSRS